MNKSFLIVRNFATSFWFKMAVAVCILWLLFHFNRIDVTILTSLTETWPWILTAFLLTIPPFAIVSYRFKVILASQGIDVPFRKALRWTMVGSFFDLAMPSSNGGDLIKAGYVVSHVGEGLRTRAVMSVAFDRVIGLLGLFLLAAIVGILGWSFLAKLPESRFLLGLSLTGSVGPLAAFRIAGSRRLYNNPRLNNWLLSKSWGPRLKNMIGAFNVLREHPKFLITALGLSILNHVFWCTALLFIAISVGNSVAPVEGFIVFPLAIFGGVFGVAGGFGAGTAAFDFLLSNLLLIQNGALIGLLFQVLSALSRLLGLPFYLSSKQKIAVDN